ncbi:malto-oligosyltrehalose synthase [Rhizobium wuzhouense]|uniref:Malto-oligosyltrehalose synthase n=1 Tax=Rhizobium wuzhouense TaxID=1986026 RepID=A0ABX5NPV7_9HYPH|nr:malto-oligosyltrehalose synthase [Rhizobium wuzhouense]PYB72549.1 malto-oligosyltrehalose synthase [Rhizobium wuzhouense]
MPIPVSTYRLQFRNGMDFERAVDLVPYLKRLGISHLYASPIFAATKGSTHGYDVTDANVIDPVLGGREGLESLSNALKSEGLGLILDIVPNHMAASLENPWWRSVVTWGEASPFARHFDIDWNRKLTLPFLGSSFEQAVMERAFSLVLDGRQGGLALKYFDSLYPLDPATYPAVLSESTDPMAARLADLGRQAKSGNAAQFHRAVLDLCHGGDCEGLLRDLDARARDADFLVFLHSLQPWRLMHFTEAAQGLNYRRFFEIAGLVGLRVEDQSVFDDVHETVLDLVRKDIVQGLRIDHVDGLADPAAYLAKLRAAIGDEVYLVVEKILAPGESLPEDWPVDGTTGYEFIAAQVPVLLDENSFFAVRAAYEQVSGGPSDIPLEMRAAKRQMIRVNFAGEVRALLREAGQFTGLDKPVLRNALEEILLSFPRYRTYGRDDGVADGDRALLDDVLRDAGRSLTDEEAQAAHRLVALLKGENAGAADHEDAAILRRRFQQLTGPLMAKSLEDTLFFRHGEFLALNEVGGELELPEGGLEHFHQEMARRAKEQPHGLSASSTHDTKRGEDARARLFAFAEDASAMAERIAGWRQIAQPHVKRLTDGPAPEPEIEWMIFQALVGHWPIDLRAEDREGLADFADRVAAFVEKSLREAKLRSDWNAVDEDYEKAVTGYVRSLLLDHPDFVADFVDQIQQLIPAGLVNGLTQTVIKLTAPGIPDIYQGSEGIDLSFVDPDNRRLPAFAVLSAFDPDAPIAFADPQALAAGRVKQAVVGRGLRLRNQHPELFARGDYVPLVAEGEKSRHILAFARVRGDEATITIACRLPLSMLVEADKGSDADFWGETSVALPDTLAVMPWRDALMDRAIPSTPRLLMRDVLKGQTVALLVAARM